VPPRGPPAPGKEKRGMRAAFPQSTCESCCPPSRGKEKKRGGISAGGPPRPKGESAQVPVCSAISSYEHPGRKKKKKREKKKKLSRSPRRQPRLVGRTEARGGGGEEGEADVLVSGASWCKREKEKKKRRGNHAFPAPPARFVTPCLARKKGKKKRKKNSPADGSWHAQKRLLAARKKRKEKKNPAFPDLAVTSKAHERGEGLLPVRWSSGHIARRKGGKEKTPVHRGSTASCTTCLNP